MNASIVNHPTIIAAIQLAIVGGHLLAIIVAHEKAGSSAAAEPRTGGTMADARCDDRLHLRRSHPALFTVSLSSHSGRFVRTNRVGRRGTFGR